MTPKKRRCPHKRNDMILVSFCERCRQKGKCKVKSGSGLDFLCQECRNIEEQEEENEYREAREKREEYF